MKTQQEINDYLLKVLTALGQMSHTKDKIDIMEMKVVVRRELLDEGWKILR